MENEVFTKICYGEEKPFRIHAQILGNYIEILIIQEESAFNSSIASSDLKNIANQQKLSLEEYHEELFDVIRNPSPDISLNFDGEEFVIYRIINKDFRLKFFNTKLEKINYFDAVEKLLDNFSAENISLSTSLKELNLQNSELDSLKTKFEQKVEELNIEKKTEEGELYGKFILILNEKKHRIQHLTELLDAFQSGSIPSNPPAVLKKLKRKGDELITKSKAQKVEVISESESSDSDGEANIEDYNTDDEGNSGSKGKLKSNDPQPSTSNNNNSDIFDLLEDKSDQVKKVMNLPSRVAKKNEGDCFSLVKENNKRDGNETNNVKSQDDDKKTEEKQKDEASQAMDFNTQQLLDML